MYIIPVNIEFQKALNFIAVAIWLAINISRVVQIRQVRWFEVGDTFTISHI